MWKSEAKSNLAVLVKAGIPYTLAGMAIVFAGLYLLKHVFADSDYLVAILFVWLAVFWGIYQPLFRKRIDRVRRSNRK